MGKIPTYSSNQLVSSAVGVPQQDRSGQIIAQGVQALTSTAASLWGERIKAKRDIDVDLARNSLIEYTAKRAPEIQQQFSSDPMKYPEALKEDLQKEVEKRSQGMDTETAAGFRKYADADVSSVFVAHMKSALDMDSRLMSSKVEKLYWDTAILGEQVKSADGLLALKKRFDVVDQRASKIWLPDTVAQKRDKYWKDAVQSSLSNQIAVSPKTVIKELMSEKSKYDEILTSAEKQKVLAEAKRTFAFNRSVSQFRNSATSLAEISEMQDQIFTGELTLAQVNRKLEWAEPRIGIMDESGAEVVSREYVDGLKGVKETLLGFDEDTSPGERRRVSKETAKDLKAGVDQLLKSQNVVGNRIERSDYKDVIRLYNKALAYKTAGILEASEFNDIKMVMDKRVKGSISKSVNVPSFTEAIQKAGKFGWFQSPKDIYDYGYQEIEQTIDKLEVPDNNKLDLKIQYMAAFTRAVDSMPSEKHKIWEKDRTAAERDAKEFWIGDGNLTSGLKATIYGKPGTSIVNGITYQYVTGEDGKKKYTIPPSVQRALRNSF